MAYELVHDILKEHSKNVSLGKLVRLQVPLNLE